MIYFYRFLNGIIKVKFYGEFYERILSFCASSGITLWETKSVENGIVAYMTIKDFYSLPKILKRSGIRVHILEKRGFPIITARYRRRWGLPVGILIFFTFLYFMSGYIWIIEINGNETVKDDVILSALEKIGISESIRSDKISPKNDREKLLLELDELAWVSLNIESSKLTVNVSETQKKPKTENSPCNLVSDYDGIIKKIDLTAGNSVVRVGDTVKKGDVLVSGIIETAGMTRFVKSSGKIIAEVSQKFTVSENFEKTELSRNGKKRSRYLIELFGIKLPLFLGRVNGDFDTKLSVSNFEISGVKLPIRLYKKTFYFKREVTFRRTQEELKLKLLDDIEKQLSKNKITDYKVKSKEFKIDKEKITLELYIISDINIARVENLLISSGNFNNNMVK